MAADISAPELSKSRPKSCREQRCSCRPTAACPGENTSKAARGPWDTASCLGTRQLQICLSWLPGHASPANHAGFLQPIGRAVRAGLEGEHWYPGSAGTGMLRELGDGNVNCETTSTAVSNPSCSNALRDGWRGEKIIPK